MALMHDMSNLMKCVDYLSHKKTRLLEAFNQASTGKFSSEMVQEQLRIHGVGIESNQVPSLNALDIEQADLLLNESELQLGIAQKMIERIQLLEKWKNATGDMKSDPLTHPSHQRINQLLTFAEIAANYARVIYRALEPAKSDQAELAISRIYQHRNNFYSGEILSGDLNEQLQSKKESFAEMDDLQAIYHHLAQISVDMGAINIKLVENMQARLRNSICFLYSASQPSGKKRDPVDVFKAKSSRTRRIHDGQVCNEGMDLYLSMAKMNIGEALLLMER